MLQPGDVLAGRYRLHERVGGGGMGDVWRGEDTVLGRPVAVKVLRASLSGESNFRERFRREARAIAALEAPGIVDVYDYGETDGQTPYLVMQFVDGMPLSRRLAGWGPLRTQDALQIMSQVADALDAAHEVGIIHRDVKPGNILLRDDGRVILVDFGIARSLGNLTMTSFGVVLGTVAYMSPEQASGEKLGPSSDIYSLGVVAHQCLTGELPFKAETPLALLAAHLRTEIPRLPDTVPRSVSSLIVRAMAKEPHERWSSAAQFAAACRQASLEPMLPIPDIKTPPPQTGDAITHAPSSSPPVITAPPPIPLPPQSGAAKAVHPVPPQSGELRAPAGPPPVSAVEADTRAPISVPRGRRPGTRGRRLVYPLTVAVMVITLTAVVTAMARPWEAADFAQDTRDRHAGGDRTSPVDTGNGELGAGNSPIVSPGSSQSSPGSPTSQSESPHGDPATSAPDSSSLDTVTIPDVLAYNESDARATLENAQLSPTVSYVGDGDVTCSVTTQDPPGGGQAKPGSTVSITVQRTIEVCPQ